VFDNTSILKFLQERISVKREDVARAKPFVLRQTITSTLAMSERWLTEQGAVPLDVINTRADDCQRRLEELARSISLRIGLFQAVWELIATGDVVPTEKCAHWVPQHGYTTQHPKHANSQSGLLTLDSISYPYVSHIASLPYLEKTVPTDTDIFLQGINCDSLHQGIRHAIDQSLDCFRRGLYMPAIAMLAAAVEATWAECGRKIAVNLSNTKLEGIVNDPFASISKKVTEIRKALEASDGKALLKSANRTVADIGNAEVWTTVLRDRRNALHWDKAKSFLIDHSDAANLLLAAPLHLGSLEAIRACC
jgi:hypothetical protein